MVSVVTGVRRAFRVGYRLKLAELRYGRVVNTFFASCTRCFTTDEPSIILADIYAEIGPAPNLLGIEILTISRVPTLAPPTALFS